MCSAARRVMLWVGLGVTAVAALAGASTASATGTACPASNPPNEIVIDGGSGQTAQLGTTFATSLQVKLANTNGCDLTGNLAGVNIDFVAPADRASGIFASTGTNVAGAGTDASGVATAPAFTANDTAGSYSVHAESDYGSVKLYLTNTASGLAASISAAGTASQTATINALYPSALQARVTDANGSPVQAATVTFQVVPGVTGAGGIFLGEQASASTRADGIATAPPLLANEKPGRFTAVASVAGVSAVAIYTLDNHAATQTVTIAPNGLTATATVARRFTAPLEARVLDANGQPLEGASVTFTITTPAAAGSTGSSGAGANFLSGGTQANELTDANGVASSPPLLANTAAGAFTAVATTSSGTQPLIYKLRNLAAKPNTIMAGAASGESTRTGTRFPIRLAVTVDDRYGNPVADATVGFRAPRRGSSGHFTTRRHAATKKTRLATVKTNREGIAVAPPFEADRKAGGYIVTATVKRAGKHVAFALLNVARSGG